MIMKRLLSKIKTYQTCKWNHHSYFQYFLDLSSIIINHMEEGPLIGTVLNECISSSRTSIQFKSAVYKRQLNLYVLKQISKQLLYATDGLSIIACVYSSLQKEPSYHPQNSLPSPFYKYEQKQSHLYLTFSSSQQSALKDQLDPYNPIFFFRKSFTDYCKFRQTIAVVKAPLDVLQVNQYSFSIVNISGTSLYAPAILLRHTKPAKSYKNLDFLQLSSILYQKYVRETMLRYRKLDLLEINPYIIADKGFQEQLPAFQVNHFHSFWQIQQYIQRQSHTIKQHEKANQLLQCFQQKMMKVLEDASTISTQNVELQTQESTWMKILSFGMSFIPYIGGLVEQKIDDYCSTKNKLKIRERAKAIMAISNDIIKTFENVLIVLFIDNQDVIKKCQNQEDEVIQTVEHIIQKLLEINKDKNKHKNSSKVQNFIMFYRAVEEVFTAQPFFVDTKYMMDRLKDQSTSQQKLLNFMKNTSYLSLPPKYHKQVKKLLAKSQQNWIELKTKKAIDTLQYAMSYVIQKNKDISSLKLPRNNQSDQIFWKTLAKMHFILRQYRQCLTITSKIDFESDFYSIFQAGHCYRELGQFQAAQRQYKSVLNSIIGVGNKEDTASIRNFLGLINFTKDQLDSALEQFYLAAELCEKNATYKCNVALTYLKKGDLFQCKIELAQCQDLLNNGFFNQRETKICKAFIQTIKQCYPYIYDEVFQELVKIKIKEMRSKASSLKYITSLNERERSFYIGIKTYLQNQYKKINTIQADQYENISQLFRLYVPIIGDALRDENKLNEILTKPRKFQQKHKLLQIAPLQEDYKQIVETFCQQSVQSSKDILQNINPQVILPIWLQKFAPSLSMLNKQLAELETAIFSYEQQGNKTQRYGSKIAYEVLNSLLSIKKQSHLFSRKKQKEKIILKMLRLTRQFLREDLSLQNSQKQKRKIKRFHNKSVKDQYSNKTDEEIDEILKANENLSLNRQKDHVYVRMDQGAEWHFSSSTNYTAYDNYTMYCCYENESFSLPLSPEQSNELSFDIKCEIYKQIHGLYDVAKDELIQKLALITDKVPKSYLDTLIKETTTKRGYQRLVKPQIIDFLNEQRETFAKELEEIKNKRDEDNKIEMRECKEQQERQIERLILEQARSYYIFDMLHFLKMMGIFMSTKELKDFIDARTGEVWDDVRKKMGRMQLKSKEKISPFLTKKQKENKAEGCEEPKEEKMDKVYMQAKENEEKKGDQNHREGRPQPKP